MPGHGEKLVYRWYIQVGEEAIYTTPDHQRICVFGRLRQTGAVSICRHVRGKKKNDYKRVSGINRY